MKCDAALLGQRMQTESDLRFLENIIDQLVDSGYNGTLINLGSTTEYWPIPMKSEYGSLKRRALTRLNSAENRAYNLVHIVCPGYVFVDGVQVAREIERSAEHVDRYVSLAPGLSVPEPCTDIEFRRAMRQFANTWFWVHLGLIVMLACAALFTKYRMVSATGALLVYTHLTSGLKFPGLAGSRDAWQPSEPLTVSIAESYKSQGLVKIPGHLLCEIPELSSDFFSAQREVDELMHSPALFHAVRKVTGFPMIPSIHSGQSPWTLSFRAPADPGKWHTDRSFCAPNLRVILQLETCENTDYMLQYFSPSGDLGSVALGTGDLLILNSQTWHKPSEMTMGCRKIAFLDFTLEECKVDLFDLLALKVTHIAKSLNIKV